MSLLSIFWPCASLLGGTHCYSGSMTQVKSHLKEKSPQASQRHFFLFYWKYTHLIHFLFLHIYAMFILFSSILFCSKPAWVNAGQMLLAQEVEDSESWERLGQKMNIFSFGYCTFFFLHLNSFMHNIYTLHLRKATCQNTSQQYRFWYS